MTEVLAETGAVIDYEHGHHRVGYEEPDDGEGEQSNVRAGSCCLLDRADGSCLADLAVRDWSRRDKRVAERLRRVDNRRMDYMRSLFGAFCPDEDEVEARCMVAFSLFIGSPFMAADHGARSRADVVTLALRRLED
jgi:hypothetical protein